MAVATEELLLKYGIDNASVQAAVAANSKVTLSLKEAQAAAASVGLPLNDFVARTGVAITESEALAAAQNDVAAATERSAMAAEKVVAAETKAAAISTGDRFRQGAMGLYNLPGIGAGNPAVFGLRGAAALSDAGVGLAGVVGVLGGVGIAAGLATLALKSVSDAEEARAKAAQKTAEALRNIVDIGTGGTTGDIESARAQQQQRLAGFQETRNDLLQIQREFSQNIKDAQGGVDPALVGARAAALSQQLSDLTGGATNDLRLLGDILKATDDDITATNLKIGEYNAALRTGSPAINDTTAAFELFKDRLKDGIENGIGGAVSFFEDAAKRAKKAAEDAKDAFQDVMDQYADTIETEGAANERIVELEQERAQVAQDAADRLSRLDEQTAERRADIATDSADRLAQIAQDNAEAIARIERDYGRSHTEAVRSRDVLADIRAKEHAADQLDDQRKAEARQQEAAEKAQDKQLRSLQRSYDSQLRTINDGVRKQNATIAAAIQQQNYIIDKAHADQIALTAMGVNQQIQLHTGLWQTIYNFAAPIVSAISGGFRQQFGYAGSAGQIDINTLPRGGTAWNNAVDARVQYNLRRVWE